MISKRAHIAVAACSLVLFGAVHPIDALAKKSGGAKKEASSKAVASGGDESAVRAQLSGLAAAASSGDAAKMASYWAPDGTFIDEAGAEIRGRQYVQERFVRAIAASGKVSVTVNSAVIKFIAPDVAWVEGSVSRQAGIDAPSPTRFTILLQRQNGNWLISSLQETAIVENSASENLSALSWLIGDWVAQQGNDKVKMTAEWTGNKNFITCKFSVNGDDSQSRVDVQIIGWDPTKEQIVSWHFDSTGGFGYGSWNRRGKQWLVNAEGVDQTGTKTTATNIFSMVDANKFSWQSVNRNANNAPVPDTVAVSVERVIR